MMTSSRLGSRRRRLPEKAVFFERLHAAISPTKVVLVAWTAALVVFVFLTFVNFEHTYFDFLVANERVSDDTTFFAYFMLIVCFGLFAGGCGVIAKVVAREVGPVGSTVASAALERELRPLVLFAVFTVIVAMAWVGGAIISTGGVNRLAELAVSENAAAREALREASFPGGRILSYGFMGIATLSSVYLPRMSDPKSRRVLVLLIVVSLGFLAVMPMLVSGRITFFVTCIASYLGATLSARRFLGFKLLFLGFVMLATVWVLKQTFTLGNTLAAQEESAAGQGWQSLLFYIYNDILNALNSYEKWDEYYTLGWYSLRFLFFMTLSDKFMLLYIAPMHSQVKEWVTAGEVPMLAASYVDFGIFGLVVIFLFGCATQYAYMKSRFDLAYTAIYGLLFSGLLMSSHSCYITEQNMVYNLIMIWVVDRLCRNRWQGAGGDRGRRAQRSSRTIASAVRPRPVTGIVEPRS